MGGNGERRTGSPVDEDEGEGPSELDDEEVSREGLPRGPDDLDRPPDDEEEGPARGVLGG